MAPPKERVVIPHVLQNVDEEIREDMKACFLAEALSKTEFKRKHKNCFGVNCVGVMREVSERVSSQQPQPEDAFPWYLAKRIIEGVHQVRIYTLNDGIAQHERFFKQLEYAPDLQKLQEPWALPPVSIEAPDITEVLMDPKSLTHIADRDIFQIEDIDKFRDDMNDASHFGSLSSTELSVYTSSDWMKAIQAQEARLNQGYPPKCIHPATPKRKKPPSPNGDDSPPPGTPSKLRRRNLNDRYPEPLRPQETGGPEFEVTDDLAAPLPDEPTTLLPDEPTAPLPDESTAPLPDETNPPSADDPTDPSIPSISVNAEHIPPDQGQVPATVSTDLPRSKSPRPRDRPQLTELEENRMKKRIINIHIDTLTTEELGLDVKKAHNNVSMLFRYPATSQLERGREPIAEAFEEDYSNHMTIRQTSQRLGDCQPIWDSVETMLSEVSAAGAEIQTSRVEQPPVREEGNAEVTAEDNITSLLPEANVFPDVPDIPDVNVPMPEIPEPNESRPEDAVENFEFRPSETRSSHSKRSRSVTTRSSIEPCPPLTGMTRRAFHEALNAKWQERMQLYNLRGPPPVDIDDVVNPAERSPLDVTLAMTYALEAMMRGELSVRQAKFYSCVMLFPRIS